MAELRKLVKRLADLKIFSIRRNQTFGELAAAAIGYSLGKRKVKDFANAEIWAKYHTNLRGEDVFIIGSTDGDPRHLIELCIMIRGAKLASAGRVTAVIPCYGGRQDRKDEPRTCITGRLYADFLEVAGADRIITMDLHAPQIQGFFKIPVDHLFSSLDFCPYFQQLNVEKLAICTTDIGGLKMAKKYKKFLHTEVLIIHDKDRPEHNQAGVSQVIGDAEGLNVLVVDDMYDTGNTFLNTVDSLIKAKTNDIYGWCPHPVLSAGALQRLQQYVRDGKIKRMMLGDTLPFDPIPEIETVSVTKTFGEAIAASFENRTVSHLFLENEDQEDEV